MPGVRRDRVTGSMENDDDRTITLGLLRGMNLATLRALRDVVAFDIESSSDPEEVLDLMRDLRMVEGHIALRTGTGER